MELNQAQQKAVRHKDGPMLVLAGPGFGKNPSYYRENQISDTKTWDSRRKYSCYNFYAGSSKGNEGEFLKTIGADYTGVNFGTFHSVFFTILKYAYNLRTDNVILEEERYAFIKDIILKLGLEYDDEKEFIGEVLSEISMVKGNRIQLSTYYSTSCGDEVFRNIYLEYNKRIRRARRIDFDDMLLLCYELLTARGDILKLWQGKFKYILIDEFQDINILQYYIVKMLAQPHNNLFIVGDDDQSIYRFRGAKPEIMLNFPTDYPDSKKILLNINYRSAMEIVDSASRLITHNKMRYDKLLKSNKRNKGEVIIKPFETMTEQNLRLVEEIIKQSKMGTPLSDMAILVRTNLGAGALIHKLMEYNIPFYAGDNLPDIYDHWITKDLISYIRIAMGESKRDLFLRIINRPKRYISRECFDSREVDFETLYSYYEDKEWMIARLDQLEYDLAMLAGMNPYAAICYIRRGIGYDDFLKEYADSRKINTEELMDVLDEIQESARDFKSYTEWFEHIEQYKEEVKEQTQKKRKKNTDGINIMTMHSSKGLEFSTVFLVDVNEGITPHKKAVLPENIEEERRLFYVAMTRAKNKLYIFSPKQRYNKIMSPSRFIGEITVNK